MKKDIKKIFGKEENRSYKIKRNLFFVILTIILISAFFFKRYFNLLTNLKYFELVNLFSIIGLLIVIFLFHLADKSFNINFRKKDYFFVYFMSIAGFILSILYYKFTYYDKVQHFFFPMMFASIAFYTLSKKLKLNKFWKLFFVFFIIVGSSSIFELLEYFLDIIFGWNLQGVFLENINIPGNYELILERIDDTMIDIALGVLGTLLYIFSVAIIEVNKRNN